MLAPAGFSCAASKMASRNHWKRRLRTFLDEFSYCLQIIFVLIGITTRVNGELNIKENDIRDWADDFGNHLNEVAKYMTYVQDIKDEFVELGALVKKKDGTKMVMDMSSEIEQMMGWKIEAVQRITEAAEEAILGHEFSENLEFEYYNAKTLNTEDGVELQLTKDKHFYNMPVNTSESSIHVPTNVYDKAADVINAIQWSESLDPIFQSNYHRDPSLNWQYFGSTTGFLRQYPAWEWPISDETVDMFDCRMRPWYIEAASSPKDLVILIDTSGSMTGLRNEIAKHVTYNILDTLNEDDYFTVFNFSDSISDLVECFNDMLVPANMENLREFKKGLQDLKTEGIANFSRALTTGFEMLHRYKRENLGSMCNQAIMLITDGAPQTFEDLFNTHNPDNKSIRMFTFLIGQDVANEQEVQWMACNNRGYYLHVSTLEEARDQVQNYIPVMTRPLVLHKQHNVIWTSIHADVEDPNMSEFLWEKGEKVSQRKRTAQIGPDNFNPLATEPSLDYEEEHDEFGAYFVNDTKYYRLITTVAYPVFDRCNCSKSNIAHLLGVAGTDVPIDEIIKLAPSYKLGVNGYCFGITNNGYILFHPDFRHVYNIPAHSGPSVGPPMLKPDYNSVDLVEVEFRDFDLPPEMDDLMLLTAEKSEMELRLKMIDREVNHTSMPVKLHQDGMKRVVTRTQEYFYSPLKETPFSFAIAMPEGYGMHEVVGMIELKDPKLNTHFEYTRKVTSLFDVRGNWTVHPDWVYCRYLFSNPERAERSREDKLVHFLKKIHNRTVNLENQHRVKPLPKYEDFSYSEFKEINKNEFFCDKELLQSVVFDADAIKVLARRGRSNKTRRTTAHKKHITVVFVATRSGLTRWEDFEDAGRNFILENNRAIDEVWYRRAVDYHSTNDSAFVYSVPFNAGSDNNVYVTASYAIFLNNGSRLMAPAAVVGMQMRHQHFADMFQCPNQNCDAVCGSDELNCYLLDNNGFVIVSENRNETGKFYGEIERNIMKNLVKDKIYRKIRIVDYQAVCFEPVPTTASSSILLTPLNHIRNLFAWTWGKILFFYMNYNFMSFGKKANAMNDESGFGHKTPSLMDIKPIPKPCDKEYYMFQLNSNIFKKDHFGHITPKKGKLACCATGIYDSCNNSSFVAHLVPFTNLIMLVVEATSPCETSSFSLKPKEIFYNETQMCQWLKASVPRRRPDNCVNFHEQELEIIGQCGRGISVVPMMPIVVFAVSLVRWLQRNFLSS